MWVGFFNPNVTNILMKIRVGKNNLCNFYSGKYLAIKILTDFNDGETGLKTDLNKTFSRREFLV